MSDFPREGIILDASCIINLYASGYMRNILESLHKKVMIASYIYELEANRIYSGPDGNVTRETKLINLQSFIDDKLLRVVSPENDVEENLVVNFSSAVALDSGEAITAAIAAHRKLSLGTDDGAAISFFVRNVPQLYLISTPDILKYWVDTTCPSLTIVSRTLGNIQNRARYKPHSKHHLYRWWQQHNNV